MIIRVRKTSMLKDLPFYLKVLMNSETQTLMFDNKRLLWNYIFFYKYERKYICQSNNGNGRWKSIALAHFSKGKNINEYWIAGAIPKQSFNTGIGIYAAVAFVSEFFTLQVYHKSC